MTTTETLQTATEQVPPPLISTSCAAAVASSAGSTLVGLCRSDYAVLASDSRTTTADDWMVAINDTRKKIHVVGGALVGLAGDDDLCDAWLERLSWRLRDVTERPSEALATVRHVQEQTATARQAMPEDLVAHALLASRRTLEPARLIACDVAATFTLRYETMAAVSTAPVIHVLRRWLGRQPTLSRAIAVAVLTVLESAIYADSVGGPVQVGVLDTRGPRLLEPDLVGAIVTALELAHGDPATALDAASRVHED